MTVASLTTPARYLATVLGMLQAAMFLGVSLGPLFGGMFAEGTRPSSEEVAARIGAEPLDVDPLVGELTAAVA